ASDDDTVTKTNPRVGVIAERFPTRCRHLRFVCRSLKVGIAMPLTAARSNGWLQTPVGRRNPGTYTKRGVLVVPDRCDRDRGSYQSSIERFRARSRSLNRLCPSYRKIQNC